jgi:hypothetical protein
MPVTFAEPTPIAFSTGTFTNTEVNGSGQLAITAGYASGEWLSEPFDATGLGNAWQVITFSGCAQPLGSNLVWYIRFASTSGGLSGATEYGPFGMADPTTGSGEFNIYAWMITNSISFAEWAQVRFVLNGG